jgi:hypothetical protein
MSIVPDPHDSQGMFSKAGKFTSEKYIVFQRKDEILYNKPRYHKANFMPDVPVDLISYILFRSARKLDLQGSVSFVCGGILQSEE